MPRYKDEPPAIRVYTVCDESKYLVVRNVPALGCGEELLKLFSTHGEVEECKPMDAEECEEFTDVYWIKFRQVNNSRFAKRKLDEYVFLGNRLQVSYAPCYESLSDTKEKLEGRRREVLARLNPGKSKSAATYKLKAVSESPATLPLDEHYRTAAYEARGDGVTSLTHVSSDKEYFSSQSMNETVKLVREKLNKIQSNAEHLEAEPPKRKRVDNRRRI